MIDRLFKKLNELFCVHFIDEFETTDTLLNDLNKTNKDYIVCKCAKCGKTIYFDDTSWEYHHLLKDGYEEFWED